MTHTFHSPAAFTWRADSRAGLVTDTGGGAPQTLLRANPLEKEQRHHVPGEELSPRLIVH